MMKKLLVVALGVLLLSGCGKFDRQLASLTGDATETCHDGVIYLQFTSGATVKYNQDGTIATCKK